MITKLISSIEFGRTVQDRDADEYMQFRINYDALLQQKPTLAMFIACVDGVPASDKKDDLMPASYYIQKIQAQDNVLFAGFVISRNDERETEICFEGVILSFYKRSNMWFDDTNGNPVQFTTLEDLTRYNLPLTPKAQQIIYGK